MEGGSDEHWAIRASEFAGTAVVLAIQAKDHGLTEEERAALREASDIACGTACGTAAALTVALKNGATEQ